MLFVVDVGNTHTVMGIYDGDELVEHWRLQTADGRTADEHGTLFGELFRASEVDRGQLSTGVMSCVVPPMEPALVEATDRYLGVELQIVGRDLEPPMEVRVDNPTEVGADRLVNASAAWARCSVPQVVVDFGTATTFDAIAEDGAYVGGAIAPGVTASSEALFERASKLPRVELARPESVIGTTTIESIQSGLAYGYIGLVREIVDRMSEELGATRVLATGGLADVLMRETELVDEIDEWLTLRGLRLAWEANVE